MKTKKIVKITNIEELCIPNLTRSKIATFLIKILSYIGIGWKDSYIWKIVVKYRDGSKKEFNAFQWLIFRPQIVNNLYKKGLCKIRFTTIYENPLDNNVLRNLLDEIIIEKKNINISTGLGRMQYNQINKTIQKISKYLNK